MSSRGLDHRSTTAISIVLYCWEKKERTGAGDEVHVHRIDEALLVLVRWDHSDLLARTRIKTLLRLVLQRLGEGVTPYNSVRQQLRQKNRGSA